MTTPPRPSNKGAFSAITAFLAIFLVLVPFYWWTATSSPDPLGSPDESSISGTGHFYNLLANGFLSGHLSLPVTPRTELLRLKNPYDPKLNAPFRLQDASLYRGRYYLYFGAVPALTLFAPWKLITGAALAQNHASVIFLAGGYAFSCLLFLLLLRAAGVKQHPAVLMVMLAALGLAQISPLVARRTVAVYEVPIVSGYCFFIGGAYFLARSILGDRDRRWEPVCAGLFLGLAVGCRPHYVLGVLVLGAAYLWVLRSRSGLGGPALARRYGDFVVPLAFCGLLLAAYNFARFGNVFEFGTTYQLTAQEGNTVRPSLSHLLPGIYYYLFPRPLWVNQFPFLYISQAAAPLGHKEWVAGSFRDERLVGLLWVAPLCVLGLALPFLALGRRFRDAAPVTCMLFALSAAGLVVFLFICCLPNLSVRYTLDYTPALLVAALFFCCRLVARTSSARNRRIIHTATIACSLWGSLAGAALSINSYDNGLKVRDPGAFKSLVSLSGGDPEAILYAFDELDFEANATLTGRQKSQREALLTTGSPNAADFVFIEYTGTGRVRFGYEHWGDGPVLGAEVVIPPQKTFHLSITYGGADKEDRTIKVAVDGQAALIIQSADPYFTSAKGVSAGSDPLGGPLHLDPFSGTLEVKDLGVGVEP